VQIVAARSLAKDNLFMLSIKLHTANGAVIVDWLSVTDAIAGIFGEDRWCGCKYLSQFRRDESQLVLQLPRCL